MNPPLKGLLISGLSILAAACSPTKMLSVTSSADEYRQQTHIAYGPNPRHHFDLYRGEESRCRVLFVYGGGWREGDKTQYGFVGAELAKRGYEVIIPDYRLYPEVQHPEFIQDIALSIRYLQDHYPSEQPFIIMGHSAGAMIGSMISYAPEYLAEQGLSTDIISANIAIAGPHDYFLPTDNPKWTAIFGEDPNTQVDALSVNHVQPGAPASLILHGTDDSIVTPKSAVSITDKLRTVGTHVTLQQYEGIGHRRIIAAVATPLHFLAPTLDDIDQYLRDQVCP